jgi:phage gpG-like protein
MTNRIDWKKKIKDIQKMKRDAPRIIGNVALQFFLKSFDDEAFSDVAPGSDPWAKRKTQTKRDRTAGRRNLLVQSGALRGSLSVKRTTWKRIEIGSYGIIYASRHNQGLKGMPKRQFIGRSQILDRKIKTLLGRQLKQIL